MDVQRPVRMLGVVVGVSVLANIGLLAWGMHLRGERQQDYVIRMSEAAHDVILANTEINDHRSGAPTADYAISVASGVLSTMNTTSQGTAHEETVADALANVEYMLTHPHRTTGRQYASAKAFMRVAAHDFQGALTPSGAIDPTKVPRTITQIARDIPAPVAQFEVKN